MCRLAWNYTIKYPSNSWRNWEHLGTIFKWARRMNILKTKNLMAGIDSHLWIVTRLKFSHVCIGKPYVCNVFCPRAMWVGVVTRTYVRDDFYLICSIRQYMEPVWLLWMYIYSYTSLIPIYRRTVWWYSDDFFLLSVSAARLLHTK